MKAALARARTALELWRTASTDDIASPSIRAAARAYDAVESVPARWSRRGYQAEKARLRWEVESLHQQHLELSASYRRTATIRDAHIRDLTTERAVLVAELDRVRRILSAADLGHLIQVKVPGPRASRS